MTENQSLYRSVSKLVQNKLNTLSKSGNEALVRSILAKLRRGVSESPGANPDIWDVTLSDLPEELVSQDGKPTAGEWAVHIALTLFALHQQGKNIKLECMHKEAPADDKYNRYSFGNAVRLLAGPNTSDAFKSVRRRFNATVTSNSIEELAHHLRGMVQLLKTKGIELDYVLLAREIYLFQFSDNRDKLRLKWGQDFYRVSSTSGISEADV